MICKATVQDASKLSYMILKNIDRVEDNLYSSAQKAAWAAENSPKATRVRLQNRTTFCAFEHGKLVGTVALDRNLLCGMYVSYSRRGQGLGQKLLDHLENYARDIGIQELILTASTNGYGFYLKNAYIPYGEVVHKYNGVKFPEIRMKKEL